MNLSTATKIKIARALSKTILTSRRLLGDESEITLSRRKGILWELDLNQGIDLQIFLWGQFEPVTAAALLQCLRPESIVIDIGANIGSHALPLAHHLRGGCVYAIEPTDWAFQRLQRNLSLNENLKDRLKLFQLALGEPNQKPPEGFFSSWNVSKRDPSAHPVHLGTFNTASARRISTLDDFIQQQNLNRVDLIKMDVDGYEVSILRGSDYTLKHMRPTFIAELAPYVLEEHGVSAEEFFDIFERNKYIFVDMKTQRPLSDSPTLLRKKLAGGSMNVKVIPAEGR